MWVILVKKLLIKFNRFIRKILKKRTKQHKILLFCSSNTMKNHIIDFYNICQKNSKDYEFYLYSTIDFDIANTIKVNSIYNIYFNYYDLVVTADLDLPFFLINTKSLFINHGLHIVRDVNSLNDILYTYGSSSLLFGKPRYTKMLESNFRIAQNIKRDIPMFADVIESVGYKFSENISNSVSNSIEYRKQFNFSETDQIVVIFSTWGKESLFHKIGDSLLLECKRLVKSNPNYKIILSNHPKEYTNYSNEVQNNGQYIERFVEKEKNFFIRKPGDDFVPYFSIADVIISDYSTMTELALITDKPIIISDFDSNIISKYSLLKKMTNVFPTFYRDSNLLEKIEESKMFNKNSEYSELKNEIFIERKKYENKVLKITDNLLKR